MKKTFKKSGPKGPRSDSAATLFRTLIAAGKADAQIRKAVKRKFPKLQLVSSTGKCVITWHRWKYRQGQTNG